MKYSEGVSNHKESCLPTGLRPRRGSLIGSARHDRVIQFSRWLVFVFVVLAYTSAYTQQKEFTIDNCVNSFNPAAVESTKAGYQYWFADKNFLDGRTLKMSVVKPHEATHPPHQHIEDEFFFVIEGRAEFILDGKTRTAGPLTSFYCPSNHEHGIRNAGDSVLKYLVIKKYEMKQ